MREQSKSCCLSQCCVHKIINVLNLGNSPATLPTAERDACIKTFSQPCEHTRCFPPKKKKKASEKDKGVNCTQNLDNHWEGLQQAPRWRVSWTALPHDICGTREPNQSCHFCICPATGAFAYSGQGHRDRSRALWS